MNDSTTPSPTPVTPEPTKIEPPVTPPAAEKPAAEKAVEGKADADKSAADKQPTVPLKADDLVFPEGFVKDDAMLGTFLETVNDPALGPKDRANKLIGLYTEAMKQVSEKGNELFAEMQRKWSDETAALPDIGGEKLDATLGGISKLIDHYGKDAEGKSFSNELRQLFDTTGMGNNPLAVRWLHNIAKDLGEGVLTPAARPGGKDTPVEDKIYTKM